MVSILFDVEFHGFCYCCIWFYVAVIFARGFCDGFATFMLRCVCVCFRCGVYMVLKCVYGFTWFFRWLVYGAYMVLYGCSLLFYLDVYGFIGCLYSLHMALHGRHMLFVRGCATCLLRVCTFVLLWIQSGSYMALYMVLCVFYYIYL